MSRSRNVLLLTQKGRPGHPRRPGHRVTSTAFGEEVGRGLWESAPLSRPRAGPGRRRSRGCSRPPVLPAVQSQAARRPEARKTPTASVRVSDGVLLSRTLYSRPHSDHEGFHNLNWLVKKKNLGRNILYFMTRGLKQVLLKNIYIDVREGGRGGER